MGLPQKDLRREEPRTLSHATMAALIAALFMWTSADGARRSDYRSRPPSDPIAAGISPPLPAAHPAPELR